MKMTYADVYRVIENRANFRLRLFADDQERFPTGERAQRIIETLHDTASIWADLDAEVADEITTSADEIATRLDDTGSD